MFGSNQSLLAHQTWNSQKNVMSLICLTKFSFLCYLLQLLFSFFFIIMIIFQSSSTSDSAWTSTTKIGDPDADSQEKVGSIDHHLSIIDLLIINRLKAALIDKALASAGDEDLISFGLIPEFVGRFPITAALKRFGLGWVALKVWNKGPIVELG